MEGRMCICDYRRFVGLLHGIHGNSLDFFTLDMAMSNLNNTPIHRAISRAFPQTNWPTTAIKMLEKFEEGKLIYSGELTAAEKQIFIDLATAGIIESHRYPVYNNEMFAGFKNSFVYCRDLDYGNYQAVEPSKKQSGILRFISRDLFYLTVIIMELVLLKACGNG